jgi:putative hemolysin
MTVIAFELAVLFVLLLANGVFAMAEIAVVSSRRARLQMLVNEGNKGAKIALQLAENPGTFLSTVQVGITLVGTLAGAMSGAALIAKLTPVLQQVPWLDEWAATLATIIVVGGITYLSVVIGELVPKRLAIQSPEGSASRLAPPMNLLSKWTSPMVHLLDKSSEVIARLLGAKGAAEPGVSEEEIRAMIHQGTLSGVFKPGEQRMVEGVLELDDLLAADVMTPKNQIVWIDLSDSNEDNFRKIAASGHSYFPVHRKVRDNVLGMLSVKSLWANLHSGDAKTDLEDLLLQPIFVPEGMRCPRIIEEFRKLRRHLALVVDEFGGVSGLITLNDMVEAVMGAMPDTLESDDAQVRKQSDGSWIADARMDVEEVAQAIGFELPPAEIEDSEYRTLAGYVIHRMGHLPKEGEGFEHAGHRFEVVDMDRHRIDKVVIRVVTPPPAAN